jgi:hypothetical protein
MNQSNSVRILLISFDSSHPRLDFRMFHISNQHFNNVPFFLLQASQQCMKVTALDQLSKGKAIPVNSQFSNFLHIRFTDGSEVISFKCRPPFTLTKIPGTHFCQRLTRPQGHSAAGMIRSIEKCNYLIGNWTRDLPACSVMLPRTPPSLQQFPK